MHYSLSSSLVLLAVGYKGMNLLMKRNRNRKQALARLFGAVYWSNYMVYWNGVSTPHVQAHFMRWNVSDLARPTDLPRRSVANGRMERLKQGPTPLLVLLGPCKNLKFTQSIDFRCILSVFLIIYIYFWKISEGDCGGQSRQMSGNRHTPLCTLARSLLQATKIHSCHPIGVKAVAQRQYCI